MVNQNFYPFLKYPLSPENVYGETKLIIENMLKNVFNSDKHGKYVF